MRVSLVRFQFGALWPCDGTGRRAGFKIRCLRACGFDSHRGHTRRYETEASAPFWAFCLRAQKDAWYVTMVRRFAHLLPHKKVASRTEHRPDFEVGDRHAWGNFGTGSLFGQRILKNRAANGNGHARNARQSVRAFKACQQYPG